MKFTQYLRPHGERKEIGIDVAASTQELADQLTLAGWKFEIEVLRTGHVHADCCNEEGQLASFIAENGPGIHVAVTTLVSEAHAAWVKGGRVPAAEHVFEEAEEPEPVIQPPLGTQPTFQEVLAAAGELLERETGARVFVGETIEVKPGRKLMEDE